MTQGRLTFEPSKFCPCGFLGFEHGLFSAEWYRRHRDHHMSVYPDLDQVSLDNLARGTCDCPSESVDWRGQSVGRVLHEPECVELRNDA